MTFNRAKYSSVSKQLSLLQPSLAPTSRSQQYCEPRTPRNNQPAITDYLITLLENLESVEQSPKFHPEGDALFHSLQVFELAQQNSAEPRLWAAALLHDVGKAIDYPDHADVGADALEGIIHPGIVWLIRHHPDLLTHPKRTRSRLKGTKELSDLEQLRTWDLQGRNPYAQTISPANAISCLIPHFNKIIDPSLIPAK